MSGTRCPDCGHEPVTVGTPCGGCGRMFFGALVLRGLRGEELVTRIDLEVGRKLLHRIVGEEAKFASEPQFAVVRDRTNGGWALCGMPGVKNETWLNDAPVAPGKRIGLKAGDEISLAGKRAHLRVELRE